MRRTGERGGKQGCGSGGSLCEAGPQQGLSVLCNTYLVPRSNRGCRRGFGDLLELHDASPLAIEEVDESGEVLLLLLLFESSSNPEMIETALLFKIWGRNRNKRKQRIYHSASLRGKDRCSHHLLKSSPNHLRVARPRASCSWL